jgi:hypothetical protein
MNPRLLVALFVAIPALSQAQTKSVPQHIADDFLTLFGSHPSYRIGHTKGIVLAGTFTPSPASDEVQLTVTRAGASA